MSNRCLGDSVIVDGQHPASPPRDLYPHFQTLADLPCPLNWAEWFGNPHPVELDIGCGRGMFLVNASLSRPDTNFVGIELDYTEGRRGARRLHKRQLPNARVVGGDAREFLRRYVPSESIAVAHVYFPDPWWKRKHRRRRLFNDEFAHLLARALRGAGELHVWTDVADYFEDIRNLMDHHPLFQSLPPPAWHEPQHDLDYLTSFHRRRTQAGAETHRGRWQKIRSWDPSLLPSWWGTERTSPATSPG
ncbi:MAG: tRNA (guanine-N(7)-)-methyltransferase [Planctomycetaceae bacterium]|nr:MAG: tRNA (guanine-N(7)-)-methyltransferase [Planctomycetaceae bacterium]